MFEYDNDGGLFFYKGQFGVTIVLFDGVWYTSLQWRYINWNLGDWDCINIWSHQDMNEAFISFIKMANDIQNDKMENPFPLAAE